MSRALGAALALTEHYFPAQDAEGRTVVRIEDAHVLLSGQAAHVWPQWEHLTYAEQQRIGRLVAQRSRRDADLASLQRRVRKGFDQGWDDPVVHRYAPGAREDWRMTTVYPRHGQRPLESADRLLVPEQRPVRIEVATGGPWSAASPRGPVQLGFEDGPVDYAPPRVTTVDATGPIPVDPDLLGWLTRAADDAMEGAAFREHQVGLLLSGTMGSGKMPPPSAVPMAPGPLRHLSAPTGVGKNVFARAQAKQLARDGHTVALLVSDNADVFGEVATLRRELKALQLDVTVTPLIAPGGRHEFALQTAHKAVDEHTPLSQMPDELRQRLAEAGYGCAVQDQLDGHDRFTDGQEPCTSLRHSDPAEFPGTALCPFVSRCDKFSHIRAACSAQIVVTTHACFQRGMVKIPVLVDGELRRQMSVRELLLRRAHLVIIDEVDAYQSRGFEASQSLVLASVSDPNTALRKVRDNLHRAPARLRVESRGSLTRAVWLAEQLLDLVSSGEICTEIRQAQKLAAGQDPRRVRQILQDRRRWYQLHRWDRELLDNLIGVRADASAGAEQMDQLQALLPPVAARPEDRVAPDVLPQRLRGIPGLLERMLSLDESGQWELDAIKEQLRTTVEHAVTRLAQERARLQHVRQGESADDDADRGNSEETDQAQSAPVLAGGVFHAVMMKAWLSALNHTVFDLADRAGELAAHAIDGASVLADTVGHRDTGNIVPFGPLGQQISGFRFEGLDDPTAKPRLLMEVLRGDPHTETAYLGDIVSLALAGHRRVVLGMSATGYLPQAARTHLLAEPQWAMPDPQRGGLSIFRSTPVVDNRTLAVGSTPFHERAERVAALARGYAPTLVKDLQRLATDTATAHRARALIAVNSYRQARIFAAALYEAALALGRKLKIFVATSDEEDPDLPPVPDAVTLVTRDQFSQLADRGGDVLISPLPRTERGLNVLTTAPSGKRESAISLIALAIRPVMPVDEPAALSASVAACAWRSASRHDSTTTPAARLAAARTTARTRLWTILAAPKRFTALPADLRRELIATVLGQCIQLAGRGRRGQTHVELHLIDGAFHDTTWGTDLPTLVRELYDSYTAEELAGTGRAYGYTAEELLQYAHAPHLLTGLRKGYPDHFGVAA
ncbi:hypothetical protein [Streptomyces endophyticus]|uniref:Uncharacterized protein n=1 Tax=Streptomyces endophyticus TaxID=714166 RepID=A0ABU6FEU4_9ACTN|nr:hypothetical protein [Streptomyces endophyticus]MEB8342566.1 hypothetical protein [Streptomyces endophyticus]